MNKNLTRSIPVVLLGIIAIPMLFVSAAFKQSTCNTSDTTELRYAPREVLTSQQLFIVEVQPIKKGKYKNKRVNFRAELRDAFQVFKYVKDTSIVELDWVMCPDGKCPEAKYYEPGTPEYAQLDILIKKAKVTLEKQERELEKLAK